LSVPGNSRHRAEVSREIAPDIEARVLHRRIECAAEAARTHAELDALADAPVLASHDVPEIHDVARVEIRLRDFRLMKHELAGDARVVRGHRPEREGGDM